MTRQAVSDRLDKLLSREALGSMLLLIVMTVALFVYRDAAGNPAVAFTDFCFWASIVVGIPASAVTIQKVGGGMLKRG